MIGSLNNTTGLSATYNPAITYPVGYQVGVLQATTLRVSITGTGTVINQVNGYYKTNKQYSVATLLYAGSQTGWILFGDVAP